MSVLARLVAVAALAVAAGTILVAPAGAAAVPPTCSTTTTTSTVVSSPTVITTSTVPSSATVTTSSSIPSSPIVTTTSTSESPTFNPLRNADAPALVAAVDPCTTTSSVTSTSTAPTTTSTAISTASPSPSPTPTAPATAITLSGVPASAHRGDSFTITITGLSPGGHFAVEMHSVIVVLGEGDADDAGHAAINVTVPVDISFGLHQIVVLGENPPESATAAIVVIADATTSSESSTTTTTTSDEPVAVLSNTGAPAATATLVLIGSGCVVLGLAFLYVTRRRRNQPGNHV